MAILISSIKSNPNNPRLIKDDRFKKLVQSIKEFPKMMELRPIVVDSDNMILGGNMRLKALQELKYKEIPNEWIKSADKLTEEEKRRFIIADNVGFGEHDWDVLANEWNPEELEDWGLSIFKQTEFDNYDPDKVDDEIEFNEKERSKKLIISFENDIEKRQFLDKVGGKFKELPTKTLSIKYDPIN